MVKNILIVEDKEAHYEMLKSIIDGMDLNVIVYKAVNAKSALEFLLDTQIHLFLIDIVLCSQKHGDISGIKFAQMVRGMEAYIFTPVIFITALEDPKYIAYSQLNCMSYIEKPFDITRVQNEILKALKFPIKSDEDRYIFFKRKGILYGKYLKEIIYIQNVQRKVIVCCENETFDIPYKTCVDIMKDLQSDSFIQCSRYTIVNKKCIEYIDYRNRYIKLRGVGELIEIGITLKKHFMNQIEGNVL